MAREKPLFRANMEQVVKTFGAQLIPIRKAADYCGIDYRVLCGEIEPKKIGGRQFVSAAQLANFLS